MNGLRTPTWRVRLLLVGVVVYVSAVVVVLVQMHSVEVSTVAEVVSLAAFGTYLLVGGLIVLRRGNNVGLLLVAYGSLWSVGKAGLVTAETLADAGRIGAASWAALVGMVAISPGSWLIAATWLVFPDGRPRTTVDRRLLRGSGSLAALAVVLTVFATPQVLPESDSYPHPLVGEQLADVLYVAVNVLFLLFFLFTIFVAARLVVRGRHGDPIERRQVGWIAVAVIGNITILMANVAIAPLGTEDNSFLLIDSVAVVLIPLAVGVAIMRYRLYEIDRIISRSVTYGALAIFIGGVYVAIVVGLGAFLGGDTGFGLSIAATALVAIAFQPMRRSVERWANRLVYGERTTPHEILVQFSHRSSELSDVELIDQAPKLIVDGTGAATAALWVRSAGGFRTASTWPPDTTERSLADGAEFVDPEADRSWPVLHDGELLGGISLTKEEGEAVTAAESALLDDLAAGLGLALRNTRLTAELRRQIAELEASRERVLAAADAARRDLENTLDSGPQQQLVALKVKLGPTRKRAEQLGATKTAALLTQLEQQAGEAIAAVREFASGIYPPLLEAEGLAVAIGQQARTSALPVSVRANDVGRYPREVESAVYFTVLEALQNTTKYASANSATVSLTAVNGTLAFEITDDGHGFDTATVGRGSGLDGIADRLDTVGGSFTISSDPGRGTTIAGIVPTTVRAGV
ncbi:MAG: ATP-binding protein [Ilumatobacteraceae bacterium]